MKKYSYDYTLCAEEPAPDFEAELTIEADSKKEAEKKMESAFYQTQVRYGFCYKYKNEQKQPEEDDPMFCSYHCDDIPGHRG
jgi:hypothetical protein